MDDETRRILEDFERRISALENRRTTDTPKLERESVVIWRGNIPQFTKKLPSTSRIAQQNAAILLLMKNMKERGDISTTSHQISKHLHLSGVDTKDIKYAFRSLRNANPKLINSKPQKRELFLTQEGELEAKKLEQELPVKE